MKFCKYIYIFVILCFYQQSIKAQDIDTVNYLDYNTEVFYEDDTEEYEPSDEEQILQDESDQAREVVLHIEDLLEYAIYLIDNDSLTYNYVIYKDSEEIVEYQKQLNDLEYVKTKEKQLFFNAKNIYIIKIKRGISYTKDFTIKKDV